MARYRPSRAGRWWRAIASATAYLAVVATLPRLGVTSAVALPPAAVVIGSLVVYIALSHRIARRATLLRRAVWVGAACGVHALLAVLSLVAVAGAVPAAETARHALAGLAPVLLALVATPLVLLPFGRRLVRRPVASARGRDARTPVVGVRPVSPPPDPDPVPSPPVPPPAEADDVRISFLRIAAQLPSEAFVLPPDRLAASLREPNVLLVPRRLVLGQLATGTVEVDWAVVAPQFPALAFVGSEVAFRQQHPDLRLTLPLDEVLRQLPPDVASDVGPVPPAVVPVVVPGSPPAPAGVLDDVVCAFAGTGTFQAGIEHVDGRSIVALVAPGLARLAVLRLGARAARFIGTGADDQVTIRTTRATIVVTAAPTAIVVATPRPGMPVALVQMRARQAAETLAGEIPSRSPHTRALTPVPLGDRVARAGLALESFGPLEAASFTDTAGDRRVFVFSAPGSRPEPLAGFAFSVWETLVDATVPESGQLVSVVFGRRGSCTIVHPVAGNALLAAAGPVTRLGRGQRDAARAAALLEKP